MTAATKDKRAGLVDVSVVLPVFNEAGHIEQEVVRIRAALDASDHSYELVAIDDASTDGSAEVLERLAAQGSVRVITNKVNRGSGGSRRIGTRESRGRVVVWTDVDMTYPNERIPELVDELERQGVDQVVGARTSEQGTHKALRVPAKWIIRNLAQYLAETPIPDLNSGFRAFHRATAVPFLHLLPRGFSCVTTITMTFLANDHTVGYLPIAYGERAGVSKFHPIADTRRYALQVVRMILSYNPLRVFMPIGLLFLLLGMAKLGFDVFTKDLRVTTNTLLLMFAGFQILAIGLLADLVVRATRRPDEL
ncbi:MAG: glycosyltransferase involved in cell wall biosynthesis [Glaciecola sp.]|jgi:glycosyltransferase involved in cell wall biosynthesis